MHGTQLVPVGDVVLETEVLGTGEPVVVIQTALTADELRPLSRHLARSGEFQVVHYHRCGYAGSTPSPRASVVADAADAGALIRAVHRAPAHVVGASYSAAVGLALAASAPDLVHSLTVVEPPPAGTTGAADFRRANVRFRDLAESRGQDAALEDFMTMIVGRDWRASSERDVPGSVAAMERDARTFFASDIPALLSWQFGAAEAAHVTSPVLYVGGSESLSWFTEMRTRVLHLLPQAEAATVAGAGHMLASTHPAEAAAMVLAHLRRHPRRPAG